MASQHKKPKLIKTVDLFSRVISKVDDWSVKTEIEQEEFSQFMWSPEDKKILRDLYLNTKNTETKSLFLDLKFKTFVLSLIENGLNTDDMKLYQQFKDRLPLRAMGLAYDLEDFHVSTSELKSKAPLHAGFYMLETQIVSSAFRSKIPLNLLADYSQKAQSTSPTDNEESLSFPVSVQTNSLTKRLIRLDKPAMMTLALDSEINSSDISVFRLIKLSKKFFISRVFKKLGKRLNLQQLNAIQDNEYQENWEAYKRVFRTDSDPVENYQDFIATQEQKAIPSNEHQLASLSKWLVKTGRVSALPKS
jgi:hypothetical protein